MSLTVGIVAHVDAGKTTLTEAMLYLSGTLRTLGRVDHGDAFLDTDRQERARGITIFSKQARMKLPGCEVVLLDTPGHVDFSTEMERTLSVLDCAILVISGSEGVQGHTRTLWQLLERHHIPTLLFINKTDLDNADKAAVWKELRSLDERCVDMTQDETARLEEIAMNDEEMLAQYLETGEADDARIRQLFSARGFFPCFFGSALRLQGVDTLLENLDWLNEPRSYPRNFSAKVFKITRDDQGTRLTHIRVTGGELSVKSLISAKGDNPAWQEKIEQIRLYSGNKYTLTQKVRAGDVCTLTGLSHSYPGMGLGEEADAPAPQLEPVLSYSVLLPESADAATALRQFRLLEEEDPLLKPEWNAQYKEIRFHLMGEVQLEVLQEMIRERFGWEVKFGPGQVAYRETITQPIEGMGHYEPLRHYAEVHLLLEPLSTGSGLEFATRCSEDLLERNWQRLILTHLQEKTHLGVLTGSPITDMRITLINGRDHLKHTEGGDFRQATYRAVRHGLMRTESRLLEPMYRFTLEIPTLQLGRALSDLQLKSAQLDPMESRGEWTVLTGTAPVSELQGYTLDVAAYTHGQGRLSCIPEGYAPCHNTAHVMETFSYEPERDVENSADSVFCSHGAGFLVPWREAASHMHIPPLPEYLRE